MTMRFLFTTLQTYESEFYARVGTELAAHGHDVSHVTVSRASAQALRSRGIDARCLADVAAAVGEPADLDAEIQRLEQTYDMPHIRDVYRADWACTGRAEQCPPSVVGHRSLTAVVSSRRLPLRSGAPVPAVRVRVTVFTRPVRVTPRTNVEAGFDQLRSTYCRACSPSRVIRRTASSCIRGTAHVANQRLAAS